MTSNVWALLETVNNPTDALRNGHIKTKWEWKPKLNGWKYSSLNKQKTPIQQTNQKNQNQQPPLPLIKIYTT